MNNPAAGPAWSSPTAISAARPRHTPPRFFLTLALALTLTTAALVRAEDCALVTLKVGKEKQLQQFAVEFYDGDAPAPVENCKKPQNKGFHKAAPIPPHLPPAFRAGLP